MAIANITLGGITGLAGIMVVAGAWLYDKNTNVSVGLIIVGIILAIAIVAVGLYTKYMDAQSRKKESDAKAEWAPFTLG